MNNQIMPLLLRISLVRIADSLKLPILEDNFLKIRALSRAYLLSSLGVLTLRTISSSYPIRYNRINSINIFVFVARGVTNE